MTRDDVIEESAEILKTPLCDIWIEDSSGEKVRFDILKNTQKRHTVSLYNSYHRVREEIEVRNYFDCTIRIGTAGLELKTDYFICTSEPLEFRDSDERLFTYGLTVGGTTMAVSFPDPNEDRKIGVLLSDRKYTEDDLKFFNIEPATDGRFPLRLLDREKEFIWLAAAWIWGIEDIEENMADYESAVDVWTWTV